MLFQIGKALDAEWLKTHILELYQIERKQTFPAWIRAAEYAGRLLEEEGFEPEIIPFPADGKTACQDKLMPIGWDVTHMRLTLETAVAGIGDPVLADYEREPLEVVKHSVATPKGGVSTRLVTQSAMKAGEDVRGAMVLLDPDARPHKRDLEMLLDLGAIGYVSDYVENPLDVPDGVSWLNAGTELANWHCCADDRDFIGFMISPRKGFYLRAACANGAVTVHVESDARRYESVLPAVTALLKGETEREIWLVAHLYEPLIDDNSSGVVGSIAVLKAIREMESRGKLHLRHSVRVLFMSEMYGSVAYIEHIGDARRKALGAINMDGLVASKDKRRDRYRAIEGPDYLGGSRTGGFAGNIMLADAVENYERAHPDVAFIRQPHHLSDDCCIGDATVGIPTIWLYHTRDGLHHNSAQDAGMIDVDALMEHLDICGEWICRMACMDESGLRTLLPRAAARANALLARAAKAGIRPDEDGQARLRFLHARELGRIEALRGYANIPEIDAAKASVVLPEFEGEERGEASSFIEACGHYRFSRRTRGFPHDLAKLPREERFVMPGDILEIDLASVVSRLDAGVALRDVVREVEWEMGRRLGEAELKRYLTTLMKLYRAGYLALEADGGVSVKALAETLRRLGIREGDAVAIDACAEAIDSLPDGAAGALEALMSAVGERGVILAPAFADSVVLSNRRVNRGAGFRPYDMREDGPLRDRTLRDNPLALSVLRKPGAARTGHVTHEWAALGAGARAFARGCDALGVPAGPDSPVMRALDADGWLVCIGVPLEDSPVAKLLRSAIRPENGESAVAQYIDASGAAQVVLVPRFPRSEPVALDERMPEASAAAFGGFSLTCVRLKALAGAMKPDD